MYIVHVHVAFTWPAVPDLVSRELCALTLIYMYRQSSTLMGYSDTHLYTYMYMCVQNVSRHVTYSVCLLDIHVASKFNNEDTHIHVHIYM